MDGPKQGESKEVFRLRRIHTSNWRGWQVHVETLLDYETRRLTFALASAFLFGPVEDGSGAVVSHLKVSSVPYVYTFFISLFKYILMSACSTFGMWIRIRIRIRIHIKLN